RVLPQDVQRAGLSGARGLKAFAPTECEAAISRCLAVQHSTGRSLLLESSPHSARPQPTFAGRLERLPQLERSHYDRCRRPPAARARRAFLALLGQGIPRLLPRRRFLPLAGGPPAAPMLARRAGSRPYPPRPVPMIVPPGAGAPPAVFARLIAQKLSDSTGKQ